MKKLLFFIFLTFLFISCSYTPVYKGTPIPKEVVENLQKSTIDTVYIIKTENNHYYFNNNKVLIEKYEVNNATSIFYLIFIIIFFLLGTVIGSLLSD